MRLPLNAATDAPNALPADARLRRIYALVVLGVASALWYDVLHTT